MVGGGGGCWALRGGDSRLQNYMAMVSKLWVGGGVLNHWSPAKNEVKMVTIGRINNRPCEANHAMLIM